MADELFRWRPVPLKQRCDRCREAATVMIDKLALCGGCFLEESERRFGVPERKRKIEMDDEERAQAV